MSFSVIMNSFIGMFDLDRNFLPCKKTKNKENFMKKIRRFVDSAIMKTCDELDLSLDPLQLRPHLAGPEAEWDFQIPFHRRTEVLL